MSLDSHSEEAGEKAGMSLVARLFITLFGLAFSGFALVFMGMGVRDAMSDWRQRSWPEVPARVVASSVVPGTGDDPHGFVISYEYQRDGEVFTGNRLRRQPVREDQISDIERLVSQYPAGSEIVCRVNPDDPAESVVEIQGGGWWMTLFGLPFLAFGIGALALAWWPAGARTKGRTRQKTSLSQGARKPGRGCAAVFFAFFGVVGLAVLVPAFILPSYRILQARNWPAVPCVVESSRVRSHDSDDGTTYSVDIVYRYRIGERELRSNRYGFLGGSSSGREGKQEVVRRHPAGSETVCYVNPDDPTMAVLERGFTTGMWLGLIPLVFVAVGLVGVVAMLRPAKTGLAIPRVAPARGDAPQSVITAAERVLQPRHGPWGRLLAGICVAAFWNGITSVFVWQAIASHLRGRPEWFLTFFIIPFVLIGLAMIGYVVYAFCALFNPRPTLRLRPGSPRLGAALECDWEFRGAAGRIRRLSIVIEGIEESRYQRGTRTYTDKSVFARLPVVEADHPTRIRRGGLAAMIPAQFAPSFRAENNRIYWVLRLHGEIARWPDVSEEYELAMLPSGTSKDATTPPGANGPPPGENRLPDGGRLSIELERPGEGFLPGSSLAGRARWELRETPKKVVVRLFWFTRGKGTQDTVIVGEQRMPTSIAGENPFHFTLPQDQPPSIDGTLISVIWAVELVVLPAAEAARVEFVVGSHGKPITLTAVPDAKGGSQRSKRWFRPG